MVWQGVFFLFKINFLKPFRLHMDGSKFVSFSSPFVPDAFYISSRQFKYWHQIRGPKKTPHSLWLTSGIPAISQAFHQFRTSILLQSKYQNDWGPTAFSTPFEVVYYFPGKLSRTGWLWALMRNTELDRPLHTQLVFGTLENQVFKNKHRTQHSFRHLSIFISSFSFVHKGGDKPEHLRGVG